MTAIGSVDVLPESRPGRPQKLQKHVLPGFRLTLGFTLVYLGSLVLLPLLALALKTVTPTEDYPSFRQVIGHVFHVALDPRSIVSYELSFGISFAAALLNGFFGLIVAWALTRYQFPGKRWADALVDLPFAMPTSVAGLALTQMFATHSGYVGQCLFDWFGWRITYTPWGILIALTFVGFPFVVRTLQPVMAGLAVEAEEAAACLGANRGQTFLRVIFPAIAPALLTGVMLAFGRGVGEYGSVVFIYGTVPFHDITPQLIINKLEEFDYVGAAGLGMVMLIFSFILVAAANLIPYWITRWRMR